MRFRSIFLKVLLVLGLSLSLYGDTIKFNNNITLNIFKNNYSECLELIEKQIDLIEKYKFYNSDTKELAEAIENMSSNFFVSFLELQNDKNIHELEHITIKDWSYYLSLGLYRKNLYDAYLDMVSKINSLLFEIINLNLESVSLFDYDFLDYSNTNNLRYKILNPDEFSRVYFPMIAYRLIHIVNNNKIFDYEQYVRDIIKNNSDISVQKKAFGAIALSYKEMINFEILQTPRIQEDTEKQYKENVLLPSVDALKDTLKALVDSEGYDVGIEDTSLFTKYFYPRFSAFMGVFVSSYNDVYTYVSTYRENLDKVEKNFSDYMSYLSSISSLNYCTEDFKCLGSIEKGKWRIKTVYQNDKEVKYYFPKEAIEKIDAMEKIYNMYKKLSEDPSKVCSYIDCNQNSNDSSNLTQSNHCPNASFSFDKSSANIGDTITATSTSTDEDGDNLTHTWTLFKPTGSNASLTYNSDKTTATFKADKAGSYTLFLNVADGHCFRNVSNKIGVSYKDATSSTIKSNNQYLLGSSKTGVGGNKGWNKGLKESDGWCVNVGIDKNNGCMNIGKYIDSIDIWLIDYTDDNGLDIVARYDKIPEMITLTSGNKTWKRYDYAPKNLHKSSELLSIDKPKEGTYYFAAYAFKSFSNASIFFSYDTNDDVDEDGVSNKNDAFPYDPDEQYDTDGDGIGDNADAFPNDPAASVDSDDDGYPDKWNDGYTQANSTTGLKLDEYPNDSTKTVDKQSDSEYNNGFAEDFSSDLSIWIIKNNDDIPGKIDIENGVLHIKRTNALGNGGGVGISKNVNIPVSDDTSLIFDTKITNRDVGDGCGWTCGEYPISVELTLEDNIGNEYKVRYALNYGNDLQDKEKENYKQITKSIPQNKWVTNLFKIKDAFSSAVKITNIYIFGNGWDFESYVDNVKISDNANISSKTVNLSKGLVAYYQFEGNAKDSSGNGNDGTEHGGVTYTDGVIGKAASFDGVDDYIELPNSESILQNTSTSFSVSGWFKLNDNGVDGAANMIISSYYSSGWDTKFGINIVEKNGILAQTMRTINGTQYDYTVNTDINTNEYKFFTIIADSTTSTLLLYIDGIKKDSTTYNPSYEYFDNSPMNIARQVFQGTGYHYLNGYIDDLRIYNRALSEDEIKALYQMGEDYILEQNMDTDQDGVLDKDDAFPNDPAASIDSDGDGYPDSWNEGYTQSDSTTGLSIDEFPNDSSKWEEEITNNAKSAIIVNDINNIDTVSQEFIKIMEDIDVIGANEIANGTKTLDNYKTLSCFIYGGDSAVSNFTDNVLEKIKTDIENGAVFISNGEVCGGKVFDYLGIRGYGAKSGWYPALKDSAFIIDYEENKLFEGVAKYSGNPKDYDVSYWDNGDYNNLIFRVDNSKSYTGRYGTVGGYIKEPDVYLAKGFSTGWSISDMQDKYPQWNIGNGKVIEASNLNWTFNQSTKEGGYIGLAGQQILKNIANGISDEIVVNLSEGLVAYYQFEGNFNDSIRNVTGVEQVASATFIDAVKSKGVKFAGVDNYRVEITPWQPNSSSFTVSSFFKVDSLDDFTTSHQAPIITEQTGDFSDGFVLRLIKNNNKIYVQFAIKDSSNYQYIQYELASNLFQQWNLLSATLNRENAKITLYLNGKEVVTKSLDMNSLTPLYAFLGAYDYKYARNGNPRYVTSTISIDDLRIYNRALSEDEIKALYQMGEQKIDLNKGLVAHYEFEGNAKDSSGNGNDGTEHGGVTYADGVIGKAASFDGVDDYVLTSKYITIQNDNSISIALWIKPELPISSNDYFAFGLERSNHQELSFRLKASSNKYQFNFRDDEWNKASVLSASNCDANWHFIYMVRDTYDNKVKIYIDGKLENTETDITTSALNEISKRLLSIGANNNSSIGIMGYYKGLIDDLRIYNRALSEDEIKALYNLGANNTTNSNKLHLKQGWNLISANISDLSSISSKARILLKYKDGKWSAYSNNSIIKNKLINKIPTFNSLKNSEGFWVYADSDLDINVLPNEKTSTTYKKGWQLAGVGDDTKTSLLQCENAKVRSIWKYKDGKWLLKTDVPNTLNLATFDTIKANEGFWIECAENDEQTNMDDQNNNQANSQTGVVWLLVKSVGGSGDWDFNYEYSDTNGVKDLKLTSQYADVEMSVSSSGYEFKVDGYARNPIKISLNSPTNFCASGNDWYIKTANNHQCDLQQSNIYVGKWSGESKLWLNDDPSTYCTWKWDVTIDSNNKGTISSSLIAHNNDQGYCASNGYATFHMEDITSSGFKGVLESSNAATFGGRNQMYINYSNSHLISINSLYIAGYAATNQITLSKTNYR